MARLTRSRWLLLRLVGLAVLALLVAPVLFGGTHAATPPAQIEQSPGPGGGPGPTGGSGTGNGAGGGGHRRGQQPGPTGPTASLQPVKPGVKPNPAPAAASNTWILLAPATSPTARRGMAMATDVNRGNIVLFGGRKAGFTVLSDTWTWDGANWTQRFPAHVPPVRFGHRMAFDPGSGDVLLFGGYGSNQAPLGDTWLWNGSDWLQQLPALSPSPRGTAGLATDATAKGVVLFGGDIFGDRTPNCYSGECAVADTWVWLGGSQWKQLNASGPSPRRGATMATQPNGQPVLLGGQLRGGIHEGVAGDTWVESSGNWTPQTMPVFPYPRQSAGFAPTNFPSQGLLLFAGKEHDYASPVSDTWLYSGGAWTQLSPTTNPPHGRTPAMATDPTTGTPLVFMGDNATNDFDNVTWRYAR